MSDYVKRLQAEMIFDDIYGNGDGKEKTVTMMMSTLSVTESAAYELFDDIAEGKK